MPIRRDTIITTPPVELLLAGTYSLTNNPTEIKLNEENARITIVEDGTYIYFVQVDLVYNNCDFNGGWPTITMYLLEDPDGEFPTIMNNSGISYTIPNWAPGIAGGSIIIPLHTLVDNSYAGMVVVVYAGLDFLPAGGSIDVVKVRIVAERLY